MPASALCPCFWRDADLSEKDKSMAQEVAALIMLGVTPITYMFAEGWADAGSTGNLTLEVKQPAEPEKPPEIRN